LFGYFLYLLLRGFSFIVNLLPESPSLWMGRRLGDLMYYIDLEHRTTALQNLHVAFGREKSETEIRSIAKRNFQNLGMMVIEFFRLPQMSVESFQDKVNIEGLEICRKALNNKKGALLLLSHFGNWELMGLMSKFLGTSIAVIARPMKKNERVNRFVGEIRRGTGLEVIPTEKASRKVIRALSQNRMVGILVDQRAKRSEGVRIDFFGKKAPSTPALAVLAMRTGAPVLPVFMIRDGHRRHRLVIKEPLQLAETGNIKKDVETNTQRMNETLESMIRQYPDQWFWVHRRWERKEKVYRR
jgi:KDO2-lipid IV(A) lauroyltransferase